MWYILTYFRRLELTCAHIYTDVSTHTHAQSRECAYTAKAQTRDLQYISIWQSMNMVIEYRIMMRSFMSIKMLLCMFQPCFNLPLVQCVYFLNNNNCMHFRYAGTW